MTMDYNLKMWSSFLCSVSAVQIGVIGVMLREQQKCLRSKPYNITFEKVIDDINNNKKDVYEDPYLDALLMCVIYMSLLSAIASVSNRPRYIFMAFVSSSLLTAFIVYIMGTNETPQNMPCSFSSFQRLGSFVFPTFVVYWICLLRQLKALFEYMTLRVLEIIPGVDPAYLIYRELFPFLFIDDFNE